ncbi:protein kinase domain-containing protein [Streptomyces uncialis]|uniref:protein kinase domain-containing protein n=1 Tax=Streptomyces uncialis TaxID=1048205 RepID=UPI003863CD82|nr:protein kinase [Streptomyces uncialis]WTE11300.1 protein kinase [Streptomyces uncialis]
MQGALLAGRYRLHESIGRGGMGRVWRAHDEVLHRDIAVKELTAAHYADEGERAVLLARTRAEARAAARITHPAVVTVHDVFEHDERPWIVMELVDGGSLAGAVAERGRIAPEEAARTGLWVARALRAAHTAGVLHRDVKPANVLLAGDGRVLLSDFGIAQVEGDSGMTRTGEIVGSVDYLSPERVRGADPGPAADLWALGATLYTAVEGVSPFRRGTALATFQAVVDEEPAEPAHAGPLTAVIAALLRKDPGDRPSAEETERLLAEAAEGRGPTVSGAPAGYTPTSAVAPETLAALREPTPPPAPPTPAAGFPSAVTTTSPTPPHGYTPPGPPQPPTPPTGYAPHGTPPHGYAAHGTPPTGYAPHGTPPGGYPYPYPVAPRPARPGWRTVTAVAVAVVLAGGGGALALRYLDWNSSGDPSAASSGTPTGATSPSGPPPTAPATGGTPAPSADTGTPAPLASPEDTPKPRESQDSAATPEQGSDAVPEGWNRAKDPVGFSLAVPEGWEREVNGSQIDYTADGGEHFIRIGYDPATDYDTPYTHLVDLEKQLSRLPDYTRRDLTSNTFRDRPGARWEFTWTSEGKSTLPGPRRAVEQAYVTRDGAEYVIYMSGPAADWSTTSAQFETVLRSWREEGS